MSFCKTGKKRDEIRKELVKLRKKDFTFESGRILGSMCTQPNSIAKEAYNLFLETNLGDPDLFPGTKKIESKIVEMLLDLMHAPKKNAMGLITSGGTEGNITAMRVAREISGKNEILLSESAHFSFQKIASLMNMKLIPIQLNKQYCIDMQKLKKHLIKNNNVAAVVGVAGSTELGTVDNIPVLSEMCEDEHIFLHIDAAFGGFVIPFLKELEFDIPDFDFKLDGVDSIEIDAHKMGCSVIPMGTLLIRNKHWLEEINVESPCVSTEKQASILGTRPGAAVAAAYAVMNYLGKDGYKKIVKNCMDTTRYAAQRIKEINLELVTEPTMNVLGIKFRNASEVVRELSERGWKVGKMRRIGCIRLVLMPHVTKNIIDQFIPDLRKVCKKFEEI